MTLTAAVAMTLPAIVLVPFGRRLIVRMFDPTVTRILVIGTGPVADRLTSRLQRCPDTRVVGACRRQRRPALPASSVDSPICPPSARAYEIDRVIVGFPNTSDAIVLEALRQLRGQVPVSEIPRYFELHNWRSETEELHGLTLMHLPTASLGTERTNHEAAHGRYARNMCAGARGSRLLIIAAAIKLDSPGPVFFRQERIGRAGKPFRIFKFRSMTADAWQRRDDVAQLNEVDGPLFKMENDPRVTRVGAFSARPASTNCLS